MGLVRPRVGAAAAAVSPIVVTPGVKERAARTAPGELGTAKTTLLLDHKLSVDFPRYKTGARPSILLCFRKKH